jgi:hypothetical protein
MRASGEVLITPRAQVNQREEGVDEPACAAAALVSRAD